MEEYLVPTQDAQAEFTEKRSTFIGHLFQTATEEEAVARIKEMREKHYDATHNVYAYILREGNLRRYSACPPCRSCSGRAWRMCAAW